jgi:L-glyceraldehyde 3-phosphate reductase
MAEMALTWVLRRKTVTSALIGASSPQQLEDNVAALKNMAFSEGELQEIEQILKI